MESEEAGLQAAVERGGHRLALVAFDLPDDKRAEFHFALRGYTLAVAKKISWRLRQQLDTTLLERGL